MCKSFKTPPHRIADCFFNDFESHDKLIAGKLKAIQNSYNPTMGDILTQGLLRNARVKIFTLTYKIFLVFPPFSNCVFLSKAKNDVHLLTIDT